MSFGRCRDISSAVFLETKADISRKLSLKKGKFQHCQHLFWWLGWMGTHTDSMKALGIFFFFFSRTFVGCIISVLHLLKAQRRRLKRRFWLPPPIRSWVRWPTGQLEVGVVADVTPTSGSGGWRHDTLIYYSNKPKQCGGMSATHTHTHTHDSHAHLQYEHTANPCASHTHAAHSLFQQPAVWNLSMADQYFLIDWPYHHGNHHLAHYLWPFIIKAIKPCVCVCVCVWVIATIRERKEAPAVCKLCSRNHNAEFSRGRHFLFNTLHLHVLLVRRDVRVPGKNRCSEHRCLHSVTHGVICPLFTSQERFLRRKSPVDKRVVSYSHPPIRR